MSAQLGAAGVDLGAMEEAPVEEAVTEMPLGGASEEAATNDAMSKDAPLDLESTQETVADAKS
jgi:small subunit ribosomal protein S2